MRYTIEVQAIQYTGSESIQVMRDTWGDFIGDDNKDYLYLYGGSQTFEVENGEWVVRCRHDHFWIVSNDEFKETYNPLEMRVI